MLSKMKKIRVLLADDHMVVREGLRALLAAAEDVEIVGEASDGWEAVRLAKTTAPEVIVMDLAMPKPDGWDLLSQIRANPETAGLLGKYLAGAESVSTYERIRMLRDRLLAGLRDMEEVYVNGDMEHRVPHNLNISFNFVEGESLIMAIKDVAVSSGSACRIGRRAEVRGTPAKNLRRGLELHVHLETHDHLVLAFPPAGGRGH